MNMRILLVSSIMPTSVYLATPETYQSCLDTVLPKSRNLTVLHWLFPDHDVGHEIVGRLLVQGVDVRPTFYKRDQAFTLEIPRHFARNAIVYWREPGAKKNAHSGLVFDPNTHRCTIDIFPEWPDE